MKRPLVVYIAGPFRASDAWGIEQNVRRAEEVALYVWRAGGVALCPHAMCRNYQGAAPDEVWLAGTLELLRRSDALLLVQGWANSDGTIAEMGEADRLGISVHEPCPDGNALPAALATLIRMSLKGEIGDGHVRPLHLRRMIDDTKEAAGNRAASIAEALVIERDNAHHVIKEAREWYRHHVAHGGSLLNGRGQGGDALRAILGVGTNGPPPPAPDPDGWEARAKGLQATLDAVAKALVFQAEDGPTFRHRAAKAVRRVARLLQGGTPADSGSDAFDSEGALRDSMESAAAGRGGWVEQPDGHPVENVET